MAKHTPNLDIQDVHHNKIAQRKNGKKRKEIETL